MVVGFVMSRDKHDPTTALKANMITALPIFCV